MGPLRGAESYNACNLMKNYRVKVEIEAHNGDLMSLETKQSFSDPDQIRLFTQGFAEAFALTHDGAVIARHIEMLDS